MYEKDFVVFLAGMEVTDRSLVMTGNPKNNVVFELRKFGGHANECPLSPKIPKYEIKTEEPNQRNIN